MIKLYKKIFSYIPEKKNITIFAIFLTIISSLLTVISYYYLYIFFNNLIIFNNLEASKKNAIIVIGLLFLGSIIYYIGVLLTHLAAFRLETNLRKKGIDGLTNSSFKFFDKNESGKIRRIIDDNAAQTHTVVAHLIPDNSRAIIVPICALILGFIVSLRVGLALIVLTFIVSFLMYKMMGEKQFMKLYQEALEKMSSEAVEYIRGIQVIKIFGTSLQSFKKLNDAIFDYGRTALAYSNSSRMPYTLIQTLMFGIACIFLPVMIVFYNNSSSTQEIIVEFIMLIFLSGVLFISMFGSMYVGMYSFLANNVIEKLENIFNEMQKDNLKFGTKENFKNFDIEFKNVTFAYDENKILENLSFKLKEKHSYALVGASGSGKSTIAKLISGFYNIDDGEILIGDENILSYSKEAIMKNIAFIFQTTNLFKKSIYENVKIGKPNASREEVMQAIKLANCEEFINKFPNKENTIIGTKGIYLSGGEKQRIAIARAILKDSKIIIMDEASASIDADNEHELQKAFSNLMKNKTVIMIAHRLSSIVSVDEILVLENGKIIERGSHKDLMQDNTKYKYYQDLYHKTNDWRLKK